MDSSGQSLYVYGKSSISALFSRHPNILYLKNQFFTLEMYSCTLFQPDPDRNGDNNSDSGSFHASVWEEERSKRSLVKWAGDESLDLDKTGNLRR